MRVTPLAVMMAPWSALNCDLARSATRRLDAESINLQDPAALLACFYSDVKQQIANHCYELRLVQLMFHVECDISQAHAVIANNTLTKRWAYDGMVCNIFLSGDALSWYETIAHHLSTDSTAYPVYQEIHTLLCQTSLKHMWARNKMTQRAGRNYLT